MYFQKKLGKTSTPQQAMGVRLVGLDERQFKPPGGGGWTGGQEIKNWGSRDLKNFQEIKNSSFTP